MTSPKFAPKYLSYKNKNYYYYFNNVYTMMLPNHNFLLVIKSIFNGNMFKIFIKVFKPILTYSIITIIRQYLYKLQNHYQIHTSVEVFYCIKKHVCKPSARKSIKSYKHIRGKTFYIIILKIIFYIYKRKILYFPEEKIT